MFGAHRRHIERILKNIAGQKITVHCTVTGQMVDRPGYLGRVRRSGIGVRRSRRSGSAFTPQIGAFSEERLTKPQRVQVVKDLREIAHKYSKVDLPSKLLEEFLHPPTSPDECIFARTTETVSADFRTKITPCQFGGEPDCAECGCYASMGMAAVGAFKLGGFAGRGDLPGVGESRLMACGCEAGACRGSGPDTDRTILRRLIHRAECRSVYHLFDAPMSRSPVVLAVPDAGAERPVTCDLDRWSRSSILEGS